MKLKSFLEDSEKTKNIVEVLAILIVGVYFLFQVFAGSFVVSMDLDPKAKFVDVGGKRALSISLSLKRGSYGSLKVHEISYRIRDAMSGKVVVDFTNFKGIAKLDVETRKEINDWVRLSPGDKKMFSEIVELEHAGPVKIEFFVVGVRDLGFTTAQWRSSIIVVE